MPIKRRTAKARARGPTDAQWAILTDSLTPALREAENPFALIDYEHSRMTLGAGALAFNLWTLYGADALAEWIADNPGTRPTLWWDFEAPRDPDAVDPGKGEILPPIPRQQLGGAGQPYNLDRVQGFRLGIPVEWELLDVDNPPIFESQAAYLGRLGLMTASERRRLKAPDYAPLRMFVDIGLDDF